MDNLAVDAELVAAARDGSLEAMDELVGRSLPLVYNIVGRALPGRADVDDVVQDAMLCVVRGLSGLRDGNAFRSWLVAVTMNQIRRHYRSRPTTSTALEEYSVVADPGADFVDLTLTQLGLSGQRRETVEATRWLDEDDRELLSLWWLVVAGHLTRSEMVDAIGLNASVVTVRVNRMKAQLETGRLVVRALGAVPRCADLSQILDPWEGRPSPLWRKRIARHLRQCERCGGLGADLIAPERLLAGLALVPVPFGHAARTTTASAASTVPGTSPRAHAAAHRASHVRRHRAGNSLTLAGKPLLVAVAVVTTIASAWGVAALARPGGGNDSGLAMAGDAGGTRSSTSGATTTDTSSSTQTATLSPTPAATTSPTRTPTHKPSSTPTQTKPSTHPSSHTPTPSSSSSATTPPPSTHTTTPTTTAPSSTSQANTPADQVLALINAARAAQGLHPYRMDAHMTTVADTHNRLMIDGCGFSHYCAGEPDPCSRDAGPDGPGMWCGENIASLGPVGDSSENTLVALGKKMTQSLLAENPDKGHRYNLLSPVHVSIGISIIYDHGTVWMTQEFSDS
ncbi:RNA polymerase sigma factor (sigma-70 family) [Catenulispora sp. MAP5-51]|uniref:sigma-70 family RNA polymerase sigma factor n=1 Tax=Catenulispora sp. MAP5-51 TaxID=3156298 RepID=UPI003518EDAB